MFIASIPLLSLLALTARAAPSPAVDHKLSSRAACNGATLSYPIGNIPNGWSSASPYLILDNQNYQRALTGRNQNGFQGSDSNSPAECISYCERNGWPIAGTEYGKECFCGAELKNGGSLDKFSYKSVMNCPGSDLNCGSADGLNLFYNNRVVTKELKRINDPTVQTNGFKATGKCLRETGDGGARLFKGDSFSAPDMTSTKCTDFCKSKGFTQAGIEYATQCYCSSTVNLDSAATSDRCDMTCGGRRTEICGGPDALTVYAAPASVPATALTPALPAVPKPVPAPAPVDEPVVAPVTPVTPIDAGSSTPPANGDAPAPAVATP